MQGQYNVTMSNKHQWNPVNSRQDLNTCTVGYIMQVAEYKYCVLVLRYESSYDLLSDKVYVV